MLHIIVNPACLAGRTVKYFRETILPLFSGTDYRIHYSTRQRGIGQIVRCLTDQASGKRRESGDYVNLVIVGGDGTMNEAVNGIMDFSHTRIGLIPTGSGNDLSKGLGLPDDVREIVSKIRKEKTYRQCDVGETICHDIGLTRLFNVSSGIGFDAEVCHLAQESYMKGIMNIVGLGKLIYFFEAVKLIFTFKVASATISFQSNLYEREEVSRNYRRFVFASAMNHKYEGGGFMLCPRALDYDRKLDVCVVHDLGAVGFFRFFPSALKGRHVRQKRFVSQLRKTSIRVRSDRPLWVHCDGETSQTSRDVEMRIGAQKLNLMM